MSILNNCVWTINDYPNEAKLWENEDDENNYPLEQIIQLENCNTLVIQYPVDRYTELEYVNVRYSITDNKVSAGQLLGWIFAFYNMPASRTLVELNSKLDNMYSEIAQRALAENDRYAKSSKLISVPLQELMGCLNFFEGLKFVSQCENTVTYQVLLGS